MPKNWQAIIKKLFSISVSKMEIYSSFNYFKILKDMPNFYSNIIEDIKQSYSVTGKITLNKEIKNVLIVSLLA